MWAGAHWAREVSPSPSIQAFPPLASFFFFLLLLLFVFLLSSSGLPWSRGQESHLAMVWTLKPVSPNETSLFIS